MDNCILRLSASAALTSMKRTLGGERPLCWGSPPTSGPCPQELTLQQDR